MLGEWDKAMTECNKVIRIADKYDWYVIVEYMDDNSEEWVKLNLEQR